MTTPRSGARAVFDALAAEHLRRPGVGRRSMFGRDTLSVDGAMYAFFRQDQLALRLPDDTAAGLLASGAAVTPEMGGRVMRRWVAVPLPENVDRDDRWRQLLDQAHVHAAGGTPPGARSIVQPATPTERFAALVEEFSGGPDVVGPGSSGRREFGSSALTVHGSIFAMLTGGRLVVKLPADRVNALIADGVGASFEAGTGRRMKQWLWVTTDDSDTWLTLAREARQFVTSQQ